jgi:hypothetical protein
MVEVFENAQAFFIVFEIMRGGEVGFDSSSFLTEFAKRRATVRKKLL